MRKRIYKLRGSTRTRLLHMEVPVKCSAPQCLKESRVINIGDDVWNPRKTRYPKTTKLYHKECWEAMYL